MKTYTSTGTHLAASGEVLRARANDKIKNHVFVILDRERRFFGDHTRLAGWPRHTIGARDDGMRAMLMEAQAGGGEQMRFSLAQARQVSYIQDMSTALAPLNDEAISVESAGMRFGEVLHHAAHDKARVVLMHDGKPVAAIVPIEDYEALEAIEDAHDAQIAAEALAAWKAAGCPRGAPLAEVAAELGIDLNAA